MIVFRRPGVLDAGRNAASPVPPPSPPPPPPPAEEFQRIDITAIEALTNWATFAPSEIARDPTVGSSWTVAHASVNGNTAAFRASFATPTRTTTGAQLFRARVRGAASGLAVKLELYAAGVLVRNLGTQTAPTTAGGTVLTWEWSASEAAAADVEARLVLVDSVSGSYYEIYALDWYARVEGEPVVDPTLAWSDEFTTLSLGDTSAYNWASYFVGWGVRHLAGNNDNAMKCADDFPAVGAWTGQTMSQVLAAHDGGVYGSGPHLHEVSNGTIKLRCYILCDLDELGDAGAGSRPAAWGFYAVAGMLSGQLSYQRGNGYWEVRLKVNAISRGQHFAIWLVRGNNDWPPELDILEMVNGDGNAYRYAHPSSAWPRVSGTDYDTAPAVGAWTTIGLELTDTHVIWYQDGVEKKRATRTSYAGVADWYIMLTWEVGTNWTGSPNSTTTWPGEVEVDYVRIYTRRPGSTEPTPGSAPWPEGWGSRPSVGTHIGLGNPFGGQLEAYHAWMGKPSTAVKVWPNSRAISSWDDIAGGLDDDPYRWSGQLDETNIKRALDPSAWPRTLPVVMALYLVPLSHSNAWSKASSNWMRPQIWQEIAAGNYDVYFQRLFRRIARRCSVTGRDPRTLVLRLAWEANGDWYPHAIGPRVAEWKSAFGRVVTIMREACMAVFGQPGQWCMVEWGPAMHLRFGTNAYNWGNLAGARLWDAYPGDAVVDICGLGIHDHIGIRSAADWTKMLRGPHNLQRNTGPGGTPNPSDTTGAMEGILDWFEWAAARNKWLGTSEIEFNHDVRPYFPRTEDHVSAWNGMHAVMQQFSGRFVYRLYLAWTPTYMWSRPGNWGIREKELYGA